MSDSDTDRIQKEVFLKASITRVWRALADSAEFGRWFGAEMKGPFVAGARVEGRVLYPGYEHMSMDLIIEQMEPPRLFSWRWHPGGAEPGEDFSHEPMTLVVFELAEVDGGTRLTVTETGFDQLPIERRARAWSDNNSGWTEQMENIARHVGQKS